MSEFLRQIVSADPAGLFGSGAQFIKSHLGTPGLIAAMILSMGILALIIAKLLKIVFDVLSYVIVPSVVVTLIATSFLPYSFVYVLPAAVALFTVLLIVKA